MDDRTAFKLFIRDAVERTLEKSEEGKSYIEYDGKQIFSVRLMGVVVSKYESERFTILTVDDSTETVSVRIFGDDRDRFEDVAVGDTVDVFGTLREYEGETYVAPWLIRRVNDPNWEVVRSLELLLRAKKTGVAAPLEEVLDAVEERSPADLKHAILELLGRLDEGDGADYNAVLKESGLSDNELDQTLNALLSESEIYEPKIGKFKKV
ncbi:OB-fold nucleic acid binding domain protein [archaeon BMS3Bbin16]|nr:OB-fold nucleic acid binding domain protein [archaeon BMS3Bbin16]